MGSFEETEQHWENWKSSCLYSVFKFNNSLFKFTIIFVWFGFDFLINHLPK